MNHQGMRRKIITPVSMCRNAVPRCVKW